MPERDMALVRIPPPLLCYTAPDLHKRGSGAVVVSGHQQPVNTHEGKREAMSDNERSRGSLSGFLLARIAEDEAAARGAAAAERPRGGWGSEAGPAGERWETRPDAGIHRGSGMLYVPTIENAADAGLWDDEGGCDYMAPALAVGEHIARHDPARVLARCEADRRIVEEWQHAQREADAGDLSGKIAALAFLIAAQSLALPYADHPDYDGEWRP